MKCYKGNERRRYFRLKYYPFDCPKFLISQKFYKVIEISEKGIKFFATKPEKFKLNTQLKGELFFCSGDSIELTGKVLRITGNEIVLLLSKEIPYKKVLQEQYYILRQYPPVR